jgi:HK97 family phage prohead protease
MKSHTSEASLEERRASPARITVDTLQDRRLRGRAITFNSLSKVIVHPRIGPFREQILSDAVNRTLKGSADVKALWDHDTREVLGSRKAGTLILTKTIRGLDIEIDPPKWAAKYVETIERGDVDGMSFNFVVPNEAGESWDFGSRDSIPIRSVKDMIFREITITPFPAYDDTSVEVSQRSIDLFLEQHRPPYNWREKYHQMQMDD